MLSLLAGLAFAPRVLEVGPNRAYSRIEDAVRVANAGDQIDVYPDPGRYAKTAILIKKSLFIRGIAPSGVEIDGNGFDYSGSGSIPRAIFQVEQGGSGTKIEGFKLFGAHNSSFNGAGVRIQAANQVTISDCTIHDNDMGIMSNGSDKDQSAGTNQTIQYCDVFNNGNDKDPGYNHNLYLGGNSVFLVRCEIHHSTTGHNVKSRAHYIRIQECYIHDAANREIDLPESVDTVRPNSNAVVLSSRIVKDATCSGNREVIHFGKEKGTRQGILFLLNDVVVTPFSSPVVDITSANCPIVLNCCALINTEQNKAELWKSLDPDQKTKFENNFASQCYGSLGKGNLSGRKGATFSCPPPSFVPRDTSVKSYTDGEIKDEIWAAWNKPRLVTWLSGDGLARTMEAPRITAGQGPRRVR